MSGSPSLSSWLGQVPIQPDRSLVVVHGGPAESVADRLAALARLHPRHAVIPVGRGTLLPLPPVARRLLRRSRARMVLVDGALDAGQRVLVAMARRRACAVAPLGIEPAALEALFAPSRRGQRALPERRPLLHRWLDRRLDSVDAIAAALGRPRTILCLGNGPSSEDERLAGVQHDSLFRVNAAWQARGHHLEPDLVFTTLMAALQSVRPRVGFVLKTRADEAVALKRRRWPFTYAVAERLGLTAPAVFGERNSPTNGAVMLALATALAPARLVVAGIDLFSHPAGAYPGDTTTANTYTMGHDKDLERAHIVALLRGYRGELVVHGDALAAALER